MSRHFHVPARLPLLPLWVVVLSFGMLVISRAVIVYDPDPPATYTSAPTGFYADSGWAFQGKYGGYLGTMIAPQYFLTAQHFGLQGGGTFISSAEFNGSADVTYTIDSAANGGLGYFDIAGTDLRVIKINETFANWAEIYTGSSEVGAEMITYGRGGPVGAEVELAGQPRGWLHTGSDGVARWGANDVDQIVLSGVGTLLAADFDPINNSHEATLSAGDSGGGVFIQAGGQWFLAGINYGVDGFFDTNSTSGDFSEFEAALYDKEGFYQGSDGTGWNLVTQPGGSKLYASRVSDSAMEIAAITGVPEPGSLGLVIISGLLLLRRGRFSASVRQR